MYDPPASPGRFRYPAPLDEDADDEPPTTPGGDSLFTTTANPLTKPPLKAFAGSWAQEAPRSPLKRAKVGSDDAATPTKLTKSPARRRVLSDLYGRLTVATEREPSGEDVAFEFAPPAPYEKARNFICQNWEHVYNYKGNHSIQAKFEEFPFALSAERYDAIITEPILRESEFIISSLITLEDSSENLNFGNKFRKRVFFENVGDKSLTVSSIRILSGPFSIIGKQVEYDAPMLIENQAYDYKFNLDVDSSLPFNLSGQSIKMFRQYSDGAAGGVTFAAVDSFGSRLTSEGNYSSFLQNNTGTIINLVTGEKSKSYNNFINQNFIKNNASSILLPGQRGYIDIAYDGNLSIEDFSSPVEGINEILNTYLLSKVFTGQLTIGVYHSNGDLEWVNSDIQIQLYR